MSGLSAAPSSCHFTLLARWFARSKRFDLAVEGGFAASWATVPIARSRGERS
jgi:hypothetical protein